MFPFSRRRRSPDPARVPVVLYTRAGCGLCDELARELERAGLRRRGEWREVDVDSDDELRRRYGDSVPVLEIGGRVAFRGRFRRELLVERFERLAARYAREPGSPPERSEHP